MRILTINKYAPTDIRSGGAEERLGSVLEELSDDHDIHLLCSRSRADRTGTVDEITVHRPFLTKNVYIAHVALTVLSPLYALFLQPDVVYEDISAAPWFVPWTCFWLPHVAIIHNFNGEQLWERGKHLKASLMTMLDKMMLTFYKSRRVITVSQHVRDKLIDNGFTKTELVFNGVSEELIQKDTEEGEAFSLLFVGRLEFRKGPDLLFDVWDELSDDYELHVVGRNEGEYRIPESATYHGYVSEERKHELFKEANVLLVPSRWEGYGIVVLEAAASHTKVVGNDAPGLREAVEDVNGEIVDFSHPHEVAKTIHDSTEQGTPTKQAKVTRSWGRAAAETERILEDESREI